MNEVNLPEGWRATKLGDVVEYGKTQKCELSDITIDTWILELEDIEKNSSRIIKRLNTSERPFKSTKNKFKEGDVLYGKLRPYLNKVVIADDNGVCSTEIIPLNAEPNVNNHYLFHWLRSETFLNYVVEVSYGVNMPRLGTKDGLLAPFILPPLTEQKVIADKLDILLAQVETTKARLDRIPQILKTFRQSVLAAAVSGKLTEEWRVENEAIRKFQKLGSAGVEVKTGPFGSALHKSDYLLDEIPVINPMHISDGRINPSASMTISEEKYNSLGAWHLKEGDVVVGRRGEMGRAAVYMGSDKMLCGTGSMILRPPANTISKYLEIILRSPTAVDYFNAASVGSTMVNLNQKVIKELEVYFPEKEEQIQIVRRVEELFAFADRIEQKANAALERVNNLTQSILAKAFRGELTADWRMQNPDLISGDNSAKALLEKIKAEREALSSKKKPKKKAVKKAK